MPTEIQLQQVLEELEARLAAEGGALGISAIAKALGTRKLSIVRDLLRRAYQEGALIVRAPERAKLKAEMEEQWRGPRYHVLDTENSEVFFRNAADVFFTELNDLLKARNSEKPLRLGIVSSRSVGKMVTEMCRKNWEVSLRTDLFPKEIKIYALNVSQTTGYGELSGNANILTWQLATKIKDVFPGKDVDAFGLSTGLLQTRDGAAQTDAEPHVSSVLRDTDPVRLGESLKKLGKSAPADLPSESQLDLIITGVGSIKDSLFRAYCERYGFDIDQQVQDHIVGDIAYWPVTRGGQLRGLRKGKDQYVFYVVVSLKVLSQLSKKQDRKVILVARNTPESKKVDPIYAAIGGTSPYCNVLITDHITAQEIVVTFKV